MSAPLPASLPFPLLAGRVHEASGPGAAGFAILACAQVPGPLLWISEDWQTARLDPAGLASFTDPGRLLLADTANQTDTLAIAEEALKDGAVALVVAEMTRPLNLREGRRLQLAAKAGGATGLCLIPEGMGSNAAETRWQCSPVFDPGRSADSTLMQWEIIKNKKGTLGIWHVRWDAAAHRLDVVSPVGLRPGAAALRG
ncbi:ImuA family protein [Paracoccus zhejiangensis]|uniref:Protein ImuA n=1 Tax=Paracoccus zhejiangensis TaxID=1077935 RepID=A0A2H5EY51_9RHOB|nr:hypothetical protein [Paracoccus zhejiangensis]AUH64236.1 hypothetical protein CX676_08765 [Paracoccus zhejiangensis]